MSYFLRKKQISPVNYWKKQISTVNFWKKQISPVNYWKKQISPVNYWKIINSWKAKFSCYFWNTYEIFYQCFPICMTTFNANEILPAFTNYNLVYFEKLFQMKFCLSVLFKSSIEKTTTTWKVSVFGVILVVSLRIQSECGKILSRIIPNTDTSHAVYLNDIFCCNLLYP